MEGAEKVSYELDNQLESPTSASVPPPFTKELSAEASIGRASEVILLKSFILLLLSICQGGGDGRG